VLAGEWVCLGWICGGNWNVLGSKPTAWPGLGFAFRSPFPSTRSLAVLKVLVDL
jgi:hypothetical protein